MEIIRSISLYCETKGLKFLLAGGHAVNYYGISRQTGDIDLIVNKDAKKDWLELLEKLDYTSFQDLSPIILLLGQLILCMLKQKHLKHC